MEKEKKPLQMPEKLLQEWECYALLAAGKAKIVCKIIDGKPVYYTEPKEQKTWGEQMEEKRQIIIGDYRVQQASNCHVSIVYIPENRLVFHSQTNHWLTEEELKAAFELYQAAAGGK